MTLLNVVILQSRSAVTTGFAVQLSWDRHIQRVSFHRELFTAWLQECSLAWPNQPATRRSGVRAAACCIRHPPQICPEYALCTKGNYKTTRAGDNKVGDLSPTLPSERLLCFDCATSHHMLSQDGCVRAKGVDESPCCATSWLPRPHATCDSFICRKLVEGQKQSEIVIACLRHHVEVRFKAMKVLSKHSNSHTWT